jgi:hypothetical protein
MYEISLKNVTPGMKINFPKRCNFVVGKSEINYAKITFAETFKITAGNK